MQFIDTNGMKLLIFGYSKRERVVAIAPEKLPYLDLTFCVEGEMHYLYNGEKVVLHSGDAIFFEKGSTRERLKTTVPTLYASINIEPDDNYEFPVTGHLPSCINNNILIMLDLFKKDFNTISSKKNEKCLSIFSYIYSNICETSRDDEPAHIKTIKQYISDNISKNINLDSISRFVHLAPQYICTLFKRQTGLTVVEYITNQRIDLAKRLIITSNDPIVKISEKCGFKDYTYFSHTFKKIAGISAKEYRKSKNT